MRFVIALLLFAPSASAALVCYADACLPVVSRFEIGVGGQLHARLGGRWETSDPTIRRMTFDGQRWREIAPARKPETERFPCPPVVKAKNYARITDSAWQEDDMTVCAQTPDFTYAGLGFYDGEGISGTGGLLRVDRRTGRVEVRRLPLLERVSVNAIVADGDVIWFGTTTNQECVGTPFVHGLVMYNWRTRELRTYEGSDDGPAGFAIHDIHLNGRALWIATDLGISRLDMPTGRWRHWLPEEKDGRIEAKELAAEVIFTRLLRTIPEDCLRVELFDNALMEGLARFRPRFLRRWKLAKR